MGGGGGEVLDKIGRGAHLSRHPLPKLGFLFLGFFLKAREAHSKKKRRQTARPQFWFWIKIRVNPI
jgi:hypothetical protein